MHIEERSNHYRPFLRSGSYPSVASLLQRRSEWLRYAGLVAIAGAASGAGYATTLWLVPVMPTVAVEQGHNALPAAAAPQPHSAAHDPELARDLAANVVVAPSAPRENTKARDAQPALADGASKRKARAPQTEKQARVDSSTSAPVKLDDANWDSLRTELIAERVRALDEAQAAQRSGAPNRPAQPSVHVEPEPLQAPQRTAANEVPAWHAATPLATVQPAQPTRLNVWPLMAAANVESLNVRGSLAASSVRRGLERLKPALVSCYGQAAQQAGRNRFGRVQVSVTIDETGRVRAPHVKGGGLPGLDSCLTGVAGKLVTEVPDTGTVAASLVVNFTP